ncbi:MAG: SDR family NAD(P)-dependent oxidoreductase [Acidobacteria bacterium]|nr:MAG: SDR family NAD(P)-dependent oxidoreductase [Acidobacteriota bacterium]REK11097.1 MAG: SDR family NAD(P)-dependent oxidoreductase [Acidobacteriota bacterium]
MSGAVQGKRVVVTCADRFMGPATCELFAEQGAEVVADLRDLRPPAACDELIDTHGCPDVLIVNLGAPSSPNTPVEDLDDDTWAEKFEVMVHPLFRLARAVLPTMKQRRAGKIVVYGSATGLRSMAKVSAYSAARAAQVGFVKAAGLEAAPHNVQINLIAQNYVENSEYYPPELVASERFQRHLARNVPAGRLATGREDAELALFLASDKSDFIVGQAIPFSGGWTLQG